MLREDRIAMFEDAMLEATRYAKEVHKKANNPNLSMRERAKARKQDSIGYGEKRTKSKGIKADFNEYKGQKAKQKHPGYKEDEDTSERYSKYLDKQIDKQGGRTNATREQMNERLSGATHEMKERLRREINKDDPEGEALQQIRSKRRYSYA